MVLDFYPVTKAYLSLLLERNCHHFASIRNRLLMRCIDIWQNRPLVVVRFNVVIEVEEIPRHRFSRVTGKSKRTLSRWCLGLITDDPALMRRLRGKRNTSTNIERHRVVAIKLSATRGSHLVISFDHPYIGGIT